MQQRLNELHLRLQSLEPRLLNICKIVGIPGCSIGVLHHGEVVWKANLGYRDVEAAVPTESDTIFNLDSVTKAMTAAALGILVAEGELDWETPLRDILPGFGKPNDPLSSLLTPFDLLSMRSGYSMLDSMSWQGGNYIFFDKKETVSLWNAIPRLTGFRTSFLYNNWGYAVIGIVIEKLSGQKLHDFLKERIFDPLGLKRTKMTDFEPDSNSSLSYAVLDDMTPVVIPDPAIGANTFMEGASGLLSTIDDMMVLYKKFIEATNDQLERKTNETPGNPFRNVAALIKGHSFLENSQVLGEQSYACGWVRCQLPGPLGMLSVNPRLVPMPQATEGALSRMCIYHQGLMPGSSANVALFPETESVVAILANASPFSDGCDWLSQIVLEELFDATTRHDYEALARVAAAKVMDHIPGMIRQLEAEQIQGTKPSLPLSSYTGKYKSDIVPFFIDIAQEGENLSISFMGSTAETYELRHYNYDTFSWMIPFNEAARRGRFIHYYLYDHFLIKFDGVEKGIDRMYWHCARDTGPESYLLLKS